MKTLEEIKSITALNDDLIHRARMILSSAPYFTYIPEERYVRLNIEDEAAIIIWPESHSGYYDSCSIEEQSKCFPAELLLMTQPEIELWKAKQKEIYDEDQRKEQQERKLAAAEALRRNELAALAALKAKYEGC